jgi:hypothetical protein
VGVTLPRHRIVLYATALALVGLIYFTLDWGASPQARLNARVLKLRHELEGDMRFINVEVLPIATDDPHVLVRGKVKSDADLADLHSKVLSATPVMPIQFDVSIVKSP